MNPELQLAYLEFRRQLFNAGSELAAERARRGAYAWLLNEIRQNNIDAEDIGEICHNFLYLEELDRRIHGSEWVDFGLPMLCPGAFGRQTFVRVPDDALKGEEGDDFYNLRFYDVHGEELPWRAVEASGSLQDAVSVARHLIKDRTDLKHWTESPDRVAVIAVTVHGKEYPNGAKITENACVFYTDPSKFHHKV